jgi:hypothetical protein
LEGEVGWGKWGEDKEIERDRKKEERKNLTII